MRARLRAFNLTPGEVSVRAWGAPCAESAGFDLFDSYHCSRYNTNTGVLTEAMFREVFASIRAELDRTDRAGAGRGMKL